MFLFNKNSKKEIRQNNEKLEIEQKKEQYKRASFKSESIGPIKIVLISIVSIICFIAVLSLSNICISAYKANIWLGHIVTGVLLAILITMIVYPIIKIFRLSNFILEYDRNNYKNVKRHNDKVIKSIAKNIIDFSDNVRDREYYNYDNINELRNSLNRKDMVEVRKKLRKIMNTTVVKKSNDIIVKYAIRSGIGSGISQSESIDGIIIIICNIMLIYDLIFLYGFRYGFVKLAKTTILILFSVVAASSLQGVKIGKGAINVIGSFLKRLPFLSVLPGLQMSAAVTIPLSSALSVVVDSGVQGIGNAAVTVIVGYQTIKYLNEEYKLQDELNDGINKLELLDEENEFNATLKQVKAELSKENKEKVTI